MQIELGAERLQAAAHAQRVADAAARLQGEGGGLVALRKDTSNLFRDRAQGMRRRVDLRGFDHVLAVDRDAGCVDLEGMCTYESLADACVQEGVMPAVVPQLKTITVGGAVSGIGIEASSFRRGLVHHTMREIEVLLPAGEVVVATPHNAQADLFFGFPNSYGSLGYALRLRMDTQPVQPFVEIRHRHLNDAGTFFEALAGACRSDVDFVDGVVFGPRELVLTTARFVPQAPWQSDYGYLRMYWRSLREGEEDYLSVRDWLWRWDTDWFWCSGNFGAQHAWMRRLLGRERLNSRTWQRWMRAASRWQLAQGWARWRGRYRESVIQDVDIPLARAAEFLAFFLREVPIVPIWICPLRGDREGERFPLYPLHAADLYVNFGFWAAVETGAALQPGHFNRRIEAEVERLAGLKSLYSDSYYTPEAFARACDMDAYARLKAKYDPQGRAPHLYDKCVRRH
jgi:FAD/FMN-containing dehydrogenase